MSSLAHFNFQQSHEELLFSEAGSEPGIAPHACNPSAQDAGDLGYTMRLCPHPQEEAHSGPATCLGHITKNNRTHSICRTLQIFVPPLLLLQNSPVSTLYFQVF